MCKLKKNHFQKVAIRNKVKGITNDVAFRLLSAGMTKALNAFSK